MLKVVRRFLNIGKELQGELLALLVGLGKVYDLRALGLGHVGGVFRGCRRLYVVLKKSSRTQVATSKKMSGEFWRTADWSGHGSPPLCNFDIASGLQTSRPNL